MRVEKKLQSPPPPVSPQRAENRPKPPQPPPVAEKPQETPKPKDLGRNLDVKA